jgi:hypothetical protein
MPIDDKHFINNGFTKSILRDSFKGYLPDEILFSTRKIGFNAGVLELCDINSNEFKEFLNQDSVFWNFIDKNKVKELFSNLSQEDFLNKAAFNLISSKIFCDIFG